MYILIIDSNFKWHGTYYVIINNLFTNINNLKKLL